MNTSRLILPSDAELAGRDSRDLAKMSRQGRLIRIRRGIYVEAKEWQDLPWESQYGMRAEAFQARAKGPLAFGHTTAALVWGLWIIGKPTKLHVVTECTAGGRNRDDIARHVGSLTEGVLECGGLRFTDKLTTTMQLTTGLPFERAVAVCDSSLTS